MISPNKEARIVLPKMNSSCFMRENYNSNNSMLSYYEKLKEYAVGWCYGENLSFRAREDQIAVMFEVLDDKDSEYPYYLDKGRYWFHIPVWTFIDIFCPTFWDEEKKDGNTN